MQHLTSVSIGYHGDSILPDPDNEMSIDKVIPFLALKSVSKACFRMVVLQYDYWDDEKEFESGVQNLTLNGNEIDGESLISLLRSLPTLRRFEYTLARETTDVSIFVPKKIGQAISHLKLCLEELVIDSNQYIVPGPLN